MRQYPIWHEITACHYKSSKSYGSVNTAQEDIYIGSSSSNSHHFAKIMTTKRNRTDEVHGDVWVFTISIDDVVIKKALFKNNKGKPGDLISITHTGENTVC